MSMDVYFLGAGKSFSGELPSALRAITKNRKALDWQLQSLERIDLSSVHFIGGYHVEDVVAQFPQLNYTIVPDWHDHNVIHTLLKAPFNPENQALVLYSDTLFRPKVIQKITSINADLVVGVDSQWLTRFANRSNSDISSSEVLNMADFDHGLGRQEVEFTGLLKLSTDAIGFLNEVDDLKTVNMISLIKGFEQTGLTVKFIDVQGGWTEFNSDLDIARFVLGTKSETLYRLFPLVKKSQIGKQVTFTVSQWCQSRAACVKKIQDRFSNKPLVVRSSSFAEDCWDESHAGGFESVLNVDSSQAEKIAAAVEQVIESYQGSDSLEVDQILIQECLSKVKMSGVVFTRSLETGAPYYRINFDDKTQSTESVTSGMGTDLRTVVVSKNHLNRVSHLSNELKQLLAGVSEIEELLGYDKLDIEFAIDEQNSLHVFQVRPIAVTYSKSLIEDSKVNNALNECAAAFSAEQNKGPGQVGNAAYFGVMPDWNPAEIIGVKAKPLAYSLYRALIVDKIWAKQRAEFGYRDMTQYPLIRTFAGQPYVNIRNSLNSFIPASVSADAAERICNAYLRLLKNNPQYHDKIEFNVALTVLTPEFDQSAKSRFEGTDVTEKDILALQHGLQSITEQAFKRLSTDVATLSQLTDGRQAILESELPVLHKALLLLDECQNHGTLAFAHAARSGFVAMTFLNGLVALNIFSQNDKDRFLSSFKTVAGEFESDAMAVSAGQVSERDYLASYGHLRPGTYDITAKAYWENPEKYLFSNKGQSIAEPSAIKSFQLNDNQKRDIGKMLKSMGLSANADELMTYCKEATQAREYVKFEFTKNLSKAMDLVIDFGREVGIKRKHLAYLSLSDLEEYNLGMMDAEGLRKSIKARKRKYALTQMVELPQLILSESDFYGFERNASEPNFVTSKSIECACVCLTESSIDLQGKIVFIEQADPGYDWMFAHGLAGLITQYGGANSHMAIRSAELNLPAAIGVGDKLYDEFKTSSIIRLNCGQKQIIKIK